MSSSELSHASRSRSRSSRAEPRIVPPRARIPATSLSVELAVAAVEETRESVLEADDFVVAVVHGPMDDGTDHGVQTGAVAACREDTDTHEGSVSWS